MIDPDELVEVITDQMMEDILHEVVEDTPKFEGLTPRLEVAAAIAYRVARHLEDYLGERNEEPVTNCHCLAPLGREDIVMGYCHGCHRPVTLRIGRTQL